MPDRTFLERPPNDPKIEGISWMNWFKEFHRKHEGGWKDEKSDIIVRGNGANDPVWTQIGATDFYAYLFPGTGVFKQCWQNQHINHDWSFDTPWYIHLHWIPNDATAGNIVWQLKVALAKGHNQQAFNFAAPYTYYLHQAAPGIQYQHMIAEMNDTQAEHLRASTRLEVDTLLKIHIMRDPAFAGGTDSAGITVGADTYGNGGAGQGNAFLDFADGHYQASRFATYNKAPDFYRKT